jgi:oxygen-independent coproporphyrinogen III oxidase
MELGFYIHIPFCLQRCYYCDFATYTHSEVSVSIQDYLSGLKNEIESVARVSPSKSLTTIYFGGGTPSLLSLQQFADIFSCLSSHGFEWSDEAEITIEINPATLDIPKVTELKKMGVNRFSVGAQTFNDQLLKKLNRKHSSKDTYDTLKLLDRLNCNYSFDLLFALPGQTISDLEFDLAEIKSFRPPHISPYYLTIPEGHILSPGRPKEDVELQMFYLIRSYLSELGYEQYEISNFSTSKTTRSKHNSIYWNDSSYLGLGLSSHSYLNMEGPFGTRFSNYRSIRDYLDWVKSWRPEKDLTQGRPTSLVEVLKPSESLTDFCHISLRRTEGLIAESICQKYNLRALDLVASRLEHSIKNDLVVRDKMGWTLTDRGRDLSNQVFLDLTFFEQDYPSAT